ncbi:MAG TPA: FHA domain-containing serine/threonine-protein kinase [Gemmataceae bacterium]|nr:FHA domain-containing serine/threonine-protein kinase [Gemmataceae bacterium]
MPMQLVTMTGMERGRVLPLRDGDIVQLGCSQNLDILTRFRDPQIARVHCEIQVQGQRVLLQDARTSNGTFVNGIRITEKELQPGDVVKIGQTEMRFTCEEGEVAPAPEPLPQPNPAHDTTEQKMQGTCFDPPPRPPSCVGDEVLAKLVGRDFVHFRVEVILGRGYWGRVFRAVDKRSQQVVALKVMRPEFGEHEGRLQRFGQALRAVLALDHPNLVRYFSAGKAANFCWACSEFIDGKSLTQLIRRNVSTGRHNWRQALQIGIEVTRALQVLHERQLLHLSLTPQNVLVGDRDKRARLGDLLVALSLQGNLIPYAPQLHNRLEETACLAPEQVRTAATLDARTDLYGVGVLLYQLVTGQAPFASESCEETIEHIDHNEPEPAQALNADVPVLLDRLILRLLAKEPEDRYASAGALLDALESVGSKIEKRA